MICRVPRGVGGRGDPLAVRLLHRAGRRLDRVVDDDALLVLVRTRLPEIQAAHA